MILETRSLLMTVVINKNGTAIVSAYHFIVVDGRGGFPLLEVFLGVVPAGRARVLMLTFATRTEFSRVSWSAFRPGRKAPESAEHWCSGSGLCIVKIWWKDVCYMWALEFHQSLLFSNLMEEVDFLLLIFIFAFGRLCLYIMIKAGWGFIQLPLYFRWISNCPWSL